MWTMQINKIIIMLLTVIGALLTLSRCGSDSAVQNAAGNTAISKDEITLYGDNAFIQEVLADGNDDICDDAIYVSPDGNDQNTGNKETPLRTVQQALDMVRPGQTIYLRNGDYCGFGIFKNSGTEGQYIVLRNYPGESPRLTMEKNCDGAVLYLNGNDYIIIDGLEIGGFSADIAQGILLDDGENHVIIRNNRIHDLVTNKPGKNNGGEANAILCYGSGITEETSIHDICIESNEIYNNTTGWCEAVSIAGNVKNVNVLNNIVHDNTNIGIDFYGNAGYCSEPSLDQPRYCTAAGNEVYRSVCDYAECAGLYVDGARDIILANNSVHDCMYGIEIGSEELQKDYPVKNIIVRNNNVYHNPAGGIRVGGYAEEGTGVVTKTSIENNMIADNGKGDNGWNGELYFAKCDGIEVKNNVIYKTVSDYPLVSSDMSNEFIRNVTFTGNIFYGPAGEEKVIFQFTGETIEGISAFNAATGGNNRFGKPTSKQSAASKIPQE